MDKFKKNFLDVATGTTRKYTDNGAAEVLVELMHECSRLDGNSFAETTEKFSNQPNYGSNGEAGGVNC
jgi:hypothetical protein